MTNRISLTVVFLILSSLIGFAQGPTPAQEAERLKAERRSKVIEALQMDAAQLKLPENRGFILAKLGAASWKEDPERSAGLFKNAVASLISAQAIAEANKSPTNQYHDLLTSQSLRPMILNTIAAADAEFALESFYKSRPLAVQKSLALGVSTAKINDLSNSPYLAQQEINLEQRLIKMIAEQKPERSIAILKESIKKQLSSETLEMLRKVWEKEPAAGNELANDVANRLLSEPFFSSTNYPNYELISLANAILTEFVRERSPQEKYIGFDESRMRSLAGKLIGLYIVRGAAMGYIPLQQLEPIAKRFSPGSYEQLKKAAENTRNFGHHGIRNNEDYTKLMSENPPAETLIAEASKFPMETRRAIYSRAATKLSDGGQYERAVALLNDNFEDDALEQAISSLNWYYAHYLINRGEFDPAESMIMQFNDSNRISALTSLANAVYGKNPEENRSRANGILQRARTFMPERPETNTELIQLFQLISAMATIEPTEAFRNLEPVVDQVNQVAEAWAIVNSFQGTNTRQGEYFLASGANFGIHLDPSLFGTLGRKDFARTMTLIDGISRREMRVLLLIGLLESGV